jgi:isopenicillin-N N-acyltransferase like protein
MTRQFTSTVAPPYERGLEFGRAHQGELSATVAAYLRLFALTRDPAADGVPADLPRVVDRLGGLALDRVDAWAPELAAEIRGIAAGAGQTDERIAALNARTEILASLGATTGECSTVVSLGAAGPIAMQNWDWYDVMSSNWLEWTIPFPDGRRVTTVTEYGVVGKIGVNDRGVGTLFNILHHRDDGAGIGVPVHVIARSILDNAANVVDAGSLCHAARADGGVTASTSITVVDSTSAVCFEVWPGGIGEVGPDDGLLIRTNHFLTEPAASGDTYPDRDTDTLQRYSGLRDALAGSRPGRDAILASLAEDRDGVCCHPIPDGPAELRHATLATIAVDPVRSALWVQAGPPCQAGRREAAAGMFVVGSTSPGE